MIRARTSAAIASQMRGANSTKVGAISRKSCIIVSGSSTKLTFIRHSSALPERIDLLHDPGQRQHRDILVVRPLGIEGEIGGAVAQQAPGREHRELRVRRGAGGRAQDRDRVALRRIHETIVEFGLTRARARAPARARSSAEIRRGSAYLRMPRGSE